MDAFWTKGEAEFRRAVRDLFGRGDGSGPASAFEVPAGLGLAGWAVVVDEAARRDPGLGMAMARGRAAAAPLAPAAATALDLARRAGTAAHVLAAGARAARDRGAFASSLMGCREVQERLAGLAAGAELLRLDACRLCRLVAEGRLERAEAESAALRARTLSRSGEVRDAAIALLGEGWAAENLPEGEVPSGDERTRP